MQKEGLAGVRISRKKMIVTTEPSLAADDRSIDTLSRQKKKTTFPRLSLFSSSNRSASNGASSSRVHNSQSQSGLSLMIR